MALPRNLTQWMKGLPITWLVGNEVGAADATSQGTVYDGQVDLLREATKARFPDYGPDDALSHIGGDRQLIQGSAESNATFRVRLRTAWDQWALAGTWVELLYQLYFSCGVEAGGAYIIQQNGLIYSLSANPVAGEDPTPLLVVDEAPIDSTSLYPEEEPFYLLGDDPEHCSRFGIIFPAPWLGPFRRLAVAEFDNSDRASIEWLDPIPGDYTLLLGPPVVPDGTGPLTVSGDETTQTQFGTDIIASGPFTGTVAVLGVPAGDNPFVNVLPSQLAVLRQVIKTWRPAKAQCQWLTFLASGNLWGWPLTLRWGDPGLVWGAPANAFTLSPEGP